MSLRLLSLSSPRQDRGNEVMLTCSFRYKGDDDDTL